MCMGGGGGGGGMGGGGMGGGGFSGFGNFGTGLSFGGGSGNLMSAPVDGIVKPVNPNVKEGEKVSIIECKPISKKKTWQVLD